MYHSFFRTWIDHQYHSRIGRYAVASRNKGSECPLEDQIELFAPSSGNDRYLRVADDPAARRESAVRAARLLQSTAAASSLSHARKARTLADSRRFFAQTKQ